MIKRIFKKILCTIIITSILIGNFCFVCYAKEFVFTKRFICINIVYTIEGYTDPEGGNDGYAVMEKDRELSYFKGFGCNWYRGGAQ